MRWLAFFPQMKNGGDGLILLTQRQMNQNQKNSTSSRISETFKNLRKRKKAASLVLRDLTEVPNHCTPI